MLSREELPGYRVIPLSRTSDPSGNSDSSLDRQDNRIDSEYDILENRFDATTVKTYRLKESASTMDRESLNEILQLAKDDEFDILMVWAIHRLTRANIWETLQYLLKLREQGIVIYSHQDGYFDWDSNADARRIVDRVINARVWRDSLVGGSVEGNKDILSEGHWPNGPLGYGLVDSEEDGIIVKSGYEWVLESIFDLFKSGNTPSEVADIIEVRIEEKGLDLEVPSKAQIETALENELYTGKLVERKSGELVQEKEDLAVIASTIFEQVEDLLEDSDENDGRSFGPQEFPPFIYELIIRFGQEYIVENISGIRWCCPKCNSIDIDVSETTINQWGISIPQIYCNEPDCYNGPVVRLNELENVDSTLPIVCPECQKTGDFTTEPISIDQFEDEIYKFTCNHCGEYMLKNKHPNTYRRALESCNAINLRDGDAADIDRESQGTISGEEEDEKKEFPDFEDATVSEQAIFAALESWLTEKGPQADSARNVLVQAANILAEEGPMAKKDLMNRLFSTTSQSYTSPKSLWEATVGPYYEDIPGFRKPTYGQYDFEREPLKYFLEWRPNGE